MKTTIHQQNIPTNWHHLACCGLFLSVCKCSVLKSSQTPHQSVLFQKEHSWCCFSSQFSTKESSHVFTASLPLSALHLLKTAVQKPSRLLVMSELFCCPEKGEGCRAWEINLQAHTGPEFPKEQNLHSEIQPSWYPAALPSTTFLWQKCLNPNNLKSWETLMFN